MFASLGKVSSEVKIVFFLRSYSGSVIPQAVRDRTRTWGELGPPAGAWLSWEGRGHPSERSVWGTACSPPPGGDAAPPESSAVSAL